MCRKVLAPMESNSAFDTESTWYMFENFVWCFGEKASGYISPSKHSVMSFTNNKW